MAINFPTSPSTNDTFTAGSITYKWDGAKWIGLGVTPTDRLVEGSNKLEIDGSNNLVWTGNNVGIGDSDPRTGLTITKAGTAPTASGNTYPMPAGNWVSTWSTGTANGNDYWAGFGGSGYAVSSATVNIALAPNHNNTSQQAGMYIAGEATSESSSDFTIGKLLSGSAIGSSDSAGNQRATKSELMRITSDGKVGINETSPSRQLSVYDGTNSGVEIKSSITGQSSVFFTDTSDGNIGMIGYTHNNDEMFFRVNDQTRLNITSGGYVTKPYQPSFIARYSVNETIWNVATDGWQKILFDEEMMDKGGNYSTTNSEFTAPVTGAYLFGAELQLEAPNGISSGYLTSGSNWMYVTFVVNGATTLDESKGGVRADANFNAMYNAYNPTHLLNLTAGDTVCMYRTGNYSSIKFKGGGESVFWGYLVA
jgi:hypothetical protein